MKIDPKESAQGADQEVIDEKTYQEHKEELMKFYDEEIPFLEKKAKYEGLITEIAVAEATRLQATTTMVTIKNQMAQAAKQFQEQAEKQKKEPVKPEA